MISAVAPLLLEAALRALFAAVAVWTGLRILRIGNVFVQKAAWGLVLAAAIALPLAPHWQGLPAFAALRLPALPWNWTPASGVEAPQPGAPDAAMPALAPASAPLKRSKNARSTKQNVMEFQGLPPIGQEQRRPMDGAQAHSRWAGEAGGQLTQAPETLQPAPPQSVPLAADRYPAPSISHEEFTAPAQSAPAESEPVLSPQPNWARRNPAAIPLAAFGWLLYLGGIAALLLRLLVGLASALRLWMTADRVPALPGSENAAGLHLRSSSRVASPVNIGSGIVLPADYSAWDEEKLRIVLAHERSHIRQGDFYLQLLAGVYASLFWFSPLGWWLKRKLSELSEAISDRAGLEEAASRSTYAQILLEFAALPRPTLTGVAMARTSHLAQRIERLLNESSFRQAFAGGGRRALLAVLLVPVALLASTALVRVEAAAAPAPRAQAAPQAQPTGQATAEQVTEPAVTAAPAAALGAAPTPEAAPVPPAPADAPSQDAMPAPPLPAADAVGPGQAPKAPNPPNPAFGDMPPMPPMPRIDIRIPQDDIRVHVDAAVRAEIAAARAEARGYRHYSYAYSDNGDAYALVGDPGTRIRFNGDRDGDRNEDIEKARKIAHGHFLWFSHEGKSYIVDDPAVVGQIEAMDKPMDELGTQMRGLGDQMRAFGQQQRELGKQMRDITVPTPDLTKEMDELKAAIASLQAKQGGTISQKDLGDLQREIGHIQGDLGSLQGKIISQQMNLNGGMGKFGEEQGKLGGQMGELGAKMGKIAHENREKINSIIDESLKNGKAKPVE